MKKIYIYITIVILFLLLGLLIGQIVVSYITKDQLSNAASDNLTTENVLGMNKYIPNSVTKIKISKYDNSNEAPFACYVSDKNKIQNFIDTFDNINFDTYDITDNISPLYIIDFLGDSTTTIVISSNKIGQLSTSDTSKFFKLSSEDFTSIEKLTDVKYYLHDSNLEKPSEDTCYNMQKLILSGLSDVEITTLQTEIHNIHSSLEFYLVDRTNILKDTNSIYWEPATIDEIFTQPNGVKIQSNGFWEYRNLLQELLKLNLNDTTRNIINDIVSKLQFGMDNRDLSECFEVHKLLHDFDYWIVNYPISSFTVAPADWGGIDCYYGLIENYNLF